LPKSTSLLVCSLVGWLDVTRVGCDCLSVSDQPAWYSPFHPHPRIKTRMGRSGANFYIAIASM
jgi:hypothetical protein